MTFGIFAAVFFFLFRTGGGTENFSCEEDSMNSDLESLLNNQNNSDSLEASASMGVTSLQDELRQLDPNIGDKIDLNRFGMLPADIEQVCHHNGP